MARFPEPASRVIPLNRNAHVALEDRERVARLQDYDIHFVDKTPATKGPWGLVVIVAAILVSAALIAFGLNHYLLEPVARHIHQVTVA